MGPGAVRPETSGWSGRSCSRPGWARPSADELPTGRELVDRYLEPLAAVPAIATSIRLDHRVIAISRRGFDKVKSAGRDEAPFELAVETAGGPQRILARAVIDASGTWGAPNPLGASGLPLPGEREAVANIRYGIPDALGADRDRFTGKHTVVVGSGHSAFNAVFDLVDLARRTGSGRVTWAIRRPDVGLMFGRGGARDALWRGSARRSAAAPGRERGGHARPRVSRPRPANHSGRHLARRRGPRLDRPGRPGRGGHGLPPEPRDGA